METASIELWHGSSHVIKHPEYGLVKPNNDYGRGFYCTRSVELAKEWACAGMDDGFANRYTLTTDGLLFLDLSQPPYTILNWLAMLVENRRFQPTTAVAAQGIEYLKQVFLPDASQADVIVGYRADDSYFSFARAFRARHAQIRVWHVRRGAGGRNHAANRLGAHSRYAASRTARRLNTRILGRMGTRILPMDQGSAVLGHSRCAVARRYRATAPDSARSRRKPIRRRVRRAGRP